MSNPQIAFKRAQQGSLWLLKKAILRFVKAPGLTDANYWSLELTELFSFVASILSKPNLISTIDFGGNTLYHQLLNI